MRFYSHLRNNSVISDTLLISCQEASPRSASTPTWPETQRGSEPASRGGYVRGTRTLPRPRRCRRRCDLIVRLERARTLLVEPVPPEGLALSEVQIAARPFDRPGHWSRNRTYSFPGGPVENAQVPMGRVVLRISPARGSRPGRGHR